MQKSILKYQLTNDPHDGDAVCVEMPIAAEILSCQFQHGMLCIWAMSRDTMLADDRHFEIHGTGTTFNSNGLKHIATVQEATYVWHVFERLHR